MAKQLMEIHNFKQEADETLYQAWDRYNDLLYKCPTHDLNKQQKVNLFYKGINIPTRQMLDSQGPIPGKTPVESLDSIQDLADHSQKWHEDSSSRFTEGNRECMSVLTNNFENLVREIKMIKENIHAIQVGCETCKGAHLARDCPLKEEVKRMDEVKYGGFNKPFQGFGGHGTKYRVRPQGYQTKIDDKAQKRTSLEDLVNQHIEESTKKRNLFKEWMIKIKEDTDRNV